MPTFTIADLNSSAMCGDKSFRYEIKSTHELLLRGQVATYYEAQISPPRSLQGLLTATTIGKLTECNIKLPTEDWSQVTVDGVGNNMFMTMFNAEGRNLLKEVKELKNQGRKKAGAARTKTTKSQLIRRHPNESRMGNAR